MLGRLVPAPACSNAARPDTTRPANRPPGKAWGDVVALLAAAAWLLAPREHEDRRRSGSGRHNCGLRRARRPITRGNGPSVVSGVAAGVARRDPES